MGSKGIKRGGERSCTSLHDGSFFPVARDMQRGRRGKKIERGEEEKKEKRGGEEEENLLLPLHRERDRKSGEIGNFETKKERERERERET